MYAKAEADLHPEQQLNYSQNWQALAQLERKRNKSTRYCYEVGLGSLATGIFNSLWLGVGITALALPLAVSDSTANPFSGRSVNAMIKATVRQRVSFEEHSQEEHPNAGIE